MRAFESRFDGNDAKGWTSRGYDRVGRIIPGLSGVIRNSAAILTAAIMRRLGASLAGDIDELGSGPIKVLA